MSTLLRLVQFCAGFRVGCGCDCKIWGALAGFLAVAVEASPEPVGEGLVATELRASPDNAGGGVPPLRRWGALRTEPPPRVPGMRLVQYQLLALSGCGRLARSVCFVSATVMKGLRLDNNKRIIFRTANNKDPSR